jgi:cellulose synthase/poly-beta-1,6-N-acetylglucosamine synthase-like glycosyltransferase
MDQAVHRLRRLQPDSSARNSAPLWQPLAGATIVGLVLGGATMLPRETVTAITAIAAVAFLSITLLRVMAIGELIGAMPRAWRKTALQPPRLPDDALPSYSILVPLFREANVLPGLIRSLRALDYPTGKLEILLVLEAVDTKTLAAVLEVELPGNVRTVVVPEHGPRTKPKALNYALQSASGDYIVVFDAEDRPEADQLRRVVGVFRRSGPELACVQAQLNIYNPRQSWFTRQFAIEYSTLFDAILPGLQRLGLPIPLGGTSNHFPRAALMAAGAWDPFNVTEDADLGIRLARLGLRTEVVDSTTWEEAPQTFAVWLTQRTRWLKGWMQTYGVHLRHPLHLARDLGWRGTIGFHALMGGVLLSSLVHPWFYVLVAWRALAGGPLASADDLLWTVAWINLAVGYAVSILAGVISVVRRGRVRLALTALAMPVYWLPISLAAYRAAFQLVRAPYLWEKTRHGAADPAPQRRSGSSRLSPAD